MKLGYDGTGNGADKKLAIYGSANAPQFVFENGGNLGLGVSNPDNPIQHSSGAMLTASGVWQNASDAKRKSGFQPVDSRQVLAALARLPVQSWRYTNELSSVRHIGPTAQDFKAAFNLGTDDKSIGTLDADGVALAERIAGGERYKDRRTEQGRGGAVGDESAPRKGGGRPVKATLLVGTLTLALTEIALAQEYAITWHTIDGGGSTSASALYTVSGTVGQPDTTAMAGGVYTLQGGFWSLFAVVPMPGRPSLTISCRSDNAVSIRWPSPSAGWNLQQNTNWITSTAWGDVTEGIADDGVWKTFIVSPQTGNRFYRLHKP